MYGFKVAGSTYGISAMMREYTSGATGAKNDMVNLESGVLAICSAGDEVLGVLNEAMASADTGVQVIVTPGLLVIADNDNDSTTFASTHIGARFDITGGTGAQEVDTSSATATAGSLSGQLSCLEYNPKGYGYDSDTSIGLYEVRERTMFV